MLYPESYRAHRWTLVRVTSFMLVLAGASSAIAAPPTDVTFVPSVENCTPLPDFSSLPCGTIADANQCQQARDAKKISCEQINAENAWYRQLFKFIWPKIEENIFELLSAVAVVALAFSTAFFKRLSEKLKKRVADPFFVRPVSFENRGLNIIVVGEGKSGKTTLIHTLSGADDANPEISTDDYATYTIVHEINILSSGRNKRDVYRLYFDDYVGQRFDNAVYNPHLEKRRKIVPPSILVIVVDLFQGPVIEGAGRFDDERIKKQIEFYTNEGILQILGSVLANGKQIVLFINKIDMALPRTGVDLTRLAKEKYKPIKDALTLMRGKQISVIVGSAKTGQGVVGYDGGVDNDRSLFKVILDAAEAFYRWDPV